MNTRNFLIGLSIAAGLLAALLAFLYTAVNDGLLGMTLFTLPYLTRIMYCEDCKTYTNHQCTKSGEFICWCARVAAKEEKEETTNDNNPGP